MREQYDDDINARNYWPNTLPPRALTARALAMLRNGRPKTEVCEKTGLTTNRVLAIHRLPERYDPVDDEVAIARALAGDGSVLPTLTFYERTVVRERLIDRYEAEPFDPSVNGSRTELGESWWLSNLADDWGTDRKLLHGRVGKAAWRRQKAAS